MAHTRDRANGRRVNLDGQTYAQAVRDRLNNETDGRLWDTMADRDASLTYRLAAEDILNGRGIVTRDDKGRSLPAPVARSPLTYATAEEAAHSLDILAAEDAKQAALLADAANEPVDLAGRLTEWEAARVEEIRRHGYRLPAGPNSDGYGRD